MGTAAIAHLKYDLDRHAVDLRRIATLASAYFIENYQIRREYLRKLMILSAILTDDSKVHSILMGE